MATLTASWDWTVMSESSKEHMAQLDWVPGAALGIAGAALAWWRAAGISEAKFQERLENIKAEMEKGAQRTKEIEARAKEIDSDFKEELCAAINELRAVTLTIAKMSSGQDVLNVVTGKTLESLTLKTEQNAKSIAEIQTTLSLIREWLERSNKA